MDARALTELDHLGRRDEALAASAAQLLEDEAGVARIRERADAIDRFFITYPDELGRLDAAIAAAASGLDRRRDELHAAEGELATARTEDERERAEKVVARAVDHLALADSALVRARAEHEAFERDAAALPAELTALETDARGIAAEARLPELPPSAEPRGLADWASRSHAELFVALSQIDTQRERIAREANELASMLLGEETYGSTVAQALQRVQARV
jgi:predicted  nucleic acid-binding Zn-ribbon protein